MTILLITEALESGAVALEDTITASAGPAPWAAPDLSPGGETCPCAIC
jgi:D-alanyl-D-alanine carboxypeptidase